MNTTNVVSIYHVGDVMADLNETEHTLLVVIDQLTERAGGIPPTLAEIAVGMGWQSSSRANVQRMLTRLRPTYVVWNERKRSLILTDAARALIARVPAQASAPHHPVSDTVLYLLASGLTQIEAGLRRGEPLLIKQYPAWRRGVNMLAAAYLMRGLDPPTHTQEVVHLCQTPPADWPIRFEMASRFLGESLLDEDGRITDYCRELADSVKGGNAEREACELLMLRIKRMAEQHGDQAGYVAVRSYVIRHPVVRQMELIMAANGPDMSRYGADLHDLYESVPSTLVEDGCVFLCGHCGWTLQRRRGRLACGSDMCGAFTEQHTLETRHMPAGGPGHLLRVRDAIRTYIVAPGIYEIDMFDDLRRRGFMAELWPNFDAYDIRVPLATDRSWAIDVKDWAYAHLLAPRLTPLRGDGDAWYTEAFYAIPDICLRHNPAYLTFLENMTRGQPFSVVTIGMLKQRVVEEQPHA